MSVFTLELVGAPSSEISIGFLQKMVNAMANSFFKYGLVSEAYPAKVDAVKSLKLRLDKYEATGNAEYLIDVANFAMIEFMRPRHPHAFYDVDKNAVSPGRVWDSGKVTEQANTDSREAFRQGDIVAPTSWSRPKPGEPGYKHEGD